ncbi:VOC family protein [Dyadobacter sp. CY261]|uniref:VOC family protein n=1 Tax=Dyadobacter sp. CY261 TaxID=2907203 RepID=UPI0038D3B230
MSYNVPTEQEVRDIYEHLKGKGVKILTAPFAPPFGGLYFYFQDVESNVLEVACNDFIPLDTDGNARGHKSIEHL